jgi:hypothetical protein
MKSFNYKGLKVNLTKQEKGWRFYESEDKTVKIKCKGMKVKKNG